jgi:NADH-quinone oxidoreductase subunit M
MITHGISTGALFIIAGTIYERIHTRDIQQMSGFWKQMPFMGTIGLIFAMASLGLPGLGNFIAEFLILIGSWKATHILTILAAIGLISGTVYSLRIVQKVFYGKEESSRILNDLSFREKLILVPLVIIIIWLGLYPQPILNTVKPGMDMMETTISTTTGLYDKTADIKPKGGHHE